MRLALGSQLDLQLSLTKSFKYLASISFSYALTTKSGPSGRKPPRIELCGTQDYGRTLAMAPYWSSPPHRLWDNARR